MSNVVNTGMMTGGNIEVIIQLIFNADDDTNPAKELNFLAEQLDDARTTYDMLELEKVEASRESRWSIFPSARSIRTEEEVNRDMSICLEMINQIERMISIRESIMKEG